MEDKLGIQNQEKPPAQARSRAAQHARTQAFNVPAARDRSGAWPRAPGSTKPIPASTTHSRPVRFMSHGEDALSPGLVENVPANEAPPPRGRTSRRRCYSRCETDDTATIFTDPSLCSEICVTFSNRSNNPGSQQMPPSGIRALGGGVRLNGVGFCQGFHGLLQVIATFP